MIKKIFISVSILTFYMLFGLFISSELKWLLFTTLSFTFIIGYVCYSYTNKSTNKQTFFLFVLPFWVLILGTVVFQENSLVTGLPYLFFIPLTSYFALIIKQKKGLWGFLIAIPLFSFIGFFILPNWFSFYQNYNSHVNKDMPFLSLVNENNEIISFNNNNKILVLDFWSTSCEVCFKKFPRFEELYLKYKNNPNVEFYSINVPVKREKISSTIKLVKDLGYQFPTLYSKEHDSIIRKQKLNFRGYPQLYILKNGKIKYEGALVTEKGVLIHSLESEIKRLLE